MYKMSGKKEGEIRVFKNGLIPEAFMWQAGKWEKIGEVITENNQQEGMTQSRYYPGDKYFDAGEYDHIFDVDDDSGVKRQIPFNDGDNALEAA
jgi:phospholipase A-2-activating protein